MSTETTPTNPWKPHTELPKGRVRALVAYHDRDWHKADPEYGPLKLEDIKDEDFDLFMTLFDYYPDYGWVPTSDGDYESDEKFFKQMKRFWWVEDKALFSELGLPKL